MGRRKLAGTPGISPPPSGPSAIADGSSASEDGSEEKKSMSLGDKDQPGSPIENNKSSPTRTIRLIVKSRRSAANSLESSSDTGTPGLKLKPHRSNRKAAAKPPDSPPDSQDPKQGTDPDSTSPNSDSAPNSKFSLTVKSTSDMPSGTTAPLAKGIPNPHHTSPAVTVPTQNGHSNVQKTVLRTPIPVKATPNLPQSSTISTKSINIPYTPPLVTPSPLLSAVNFMGVPIQGAASYLQQIMAGQLATNHNTSRSVQRPASGTSSSKPDAAPAPPTRSLRSTPKPRTPVPSSSRRTTPISFGRTPIKSMETRDTDDSGTLGSTEERSSAPVQQELPPSLRSADVSSSESNLAANPHGYRPSSALALNDSLAVSATKRKGDDTDPTERTVKRPRTTEPYQRHERFWLPRGEAIIRLDDVIFKVSPSLLEENSAYFAELFARSLAEPAGVEQQHSHPVLDGRTVYRVEKSNPVDFAHLLDVLYHTAKFVTVPPSFDILSSVLRASSALAFPDLFHWAVIRLENMWPADPPCTPGHVLPHAIETILLAKEYNVPRVLKRSMYEVARSSLYGYTRDMSNAVQGKDESAPAARTQLSQKELLGIIDASRKLSHAWMDIVSRPPKAFLCTHRPADFTADLSQSPQPKTHSETVVLRWSTVVLGSGLSRRFLNDPILGLTALRKTIRWKEHGFCERCVADAKEVWLAQQKELWKNLDVWFGLV